MSLKIFLWLSLFVINVSSQSYEDKRCRCICPSPAAVFNETMSKDRRLFKDSVPASKCNCVDVIVARIGDEIKGREQQYCRSCECKFEQRNTTVIMIVVLVVLWVLSMLTVYMGFLMLLVPLMRKKRSRQYMEPGTEENQNLLFQDDDD